MADTLRVPFGKPVGMYAKDHAASHPDQPLFIMATSGNTLTYAEFEDHWVSAVLTDQSRPMDAMRRLQQRFPWCANVAFAPSTVVSDGQTSYAARVRGRSDSEIVDSRASR